MIPINEIEEGFYEATPRCYDEKIVVQVVFRISRLSLMAKRKGKWFSLKYFDFIQSINIPDYSMFEGTEKQQQALLIACNFGRYSEVKYLLEQGVATSYKLSENSGFMNAVFNGYPDVVRLLLSYGVNLDEKGVGGETALDQAKDRGNWEIISMIEKEIRKQNQSKG